MKPKIQPPLSALPAALVFAALLTLTLTGCSSAPTAVERFFYDIKTNEVTHVTSTTNIIEGVQHIATQTNIAQEIVWEIKPTVTTVSKVGSSIVDSLFPGIGQFALVIITGILGIFGYNRQKKLTNAVAAADGHEEMSTKYQLATESLVQSLEVFREVMKATPQGVALNAKLTDLLQKHQMTAGVIREVATFVSLVDNEKAKRTATAILETLPPPPAAA